jgi:hypothetical protein
MTATAHAAPEKKSGDKGIVHVQQKKFRKEKDREKRRNNGTQYCRKSPGLSCKFLSRKPGKVCGNGPGESRSKNDHFHRFFGRKFFCSPKLALEQADHYDSSAES